jgi:alpha-L-arabinofuranosidase
MLGSYSALPAVPASASVTDALWVDISATIRPVDPRIIGITTNYLTDNDDVRNLGRSYLEALQDLGVKSLRYPGGEKSDAYLWSVSPFTAPLPTLSRTGPNEWPSGDTNFVRDYTTFIHNPLDFDEFMAYAKSLGAEPTLVVDFDSMYKQATAGGTAPTKQQLEDTAVAWVRYANVTKGYNVKYWEIGNESYLNAYNGGARAADYARDLIEFAQAMKAVDPTIKIGANGPDDQYKRGELDTRGYWWKTVLATAAPEIDFLSIHSYPTWQWGSYDYYRTHTPDFAASIDSPEHALNDWAPNEADRIRIALTEVNAADWSGSWPNKNDLGHALVLFEMFGTYLKHPKLDHAQFWNTRWIAITDATDIFNAVDINQNLLPTGRVLSIWGHFLKQNMIATSSTDMIHSFASYTLSTEELSVFIINKDIGAHKLELSLINYQCPCTEERWVLTGTGPQDLSPTWVKQATVTSIDNRLELNLDPVSVTVVTLQPQRQDSLPGYSLYIPLLAYYQP